MWRTDPFLDNDRERNNKATVAAWQQILNWQHLNYNNRGKGKKVGLSL
jgi:hypothetical protein